MQHVVRWETRLNAPPPAPPPPPQLQPLQPGPPPPQPHGRAPSATPPPPPPSRRQPVSPLTAQTHTHEPLDVLTANIRRLFQKLDSDRRLAAASLRSKWASMDAMIESGLPLLLVEAQDIDPKSERFSTEGALYALESLQILVLLPAARRALVKGATDALPAQNSVAAAQTAVPLPGQARPPRSPLAILLHLSSVADLARVAPEVTYSALKVLALCVHPLTSLLPTPPADTTGAAAGAVTAGEIGAGRMTPGPANRRGGGEASSSAGPATGGDPAGTSLWISHQESIYKAAREAVRGNNGIKVMINLLQSQNPPPGAPLLAVRAASCRVLLGLARDPMIKAILAKLQISNLLADQLRDPNLNFSWGSAKASGPVLIGGVGEDVFGGAEPSEDLTKASLELLAQVNVDGAAHGGPNVASEILSLSRIQKAQIANATPIVYNPRELLALIYEHLMASGLGDSAATLAREAALSLAPAAQAPAAPALAPVAPQPAQQPPPPQQLQQGPRAAATAEPPKRKATTIEASAAAAAAATAGPSSNSVGPAAAGTVVGFPPHGETPASAPAPMPVPSATGLVTPRATALGGLLGAAAAAAMATPEMGNKKKLGFSQRLHQSVGGGGKDDPSTMPVRCAGAFCVP